MKKFIYFSFIMILASQTNAMDFNGFKRCLRQEFNKELINDYKNSSSMLFLNAISHSVELYLDYEDLRTTSGFVNSIKLSKTCVELAKNLSLETGADYSDAEIKKINATEAFKIIQMQLENK